MAAVCLPHVGADLSIHGRCAALGGLAGGLAGSVVFCLWGAAAAGSAGWVTTFTRASIPQIEIISAIIRQTMGMFLVLFLSGSGLGAIGGWLSNHRNRNRTDDFDKTEPQMALNASITALPASIVAAGMAGAIFSRLADYLGGQSGQTGFDGRNLETPLVVALLLVLVSHIALTLVVPHEARQAEHLCGMDEVKMGAYVSIGAAPLMVLLLFLVDVLSFSNPLVMVAILASAGSQSDIVPHLDQVDPARADCLPCTPGWQTKNRSKTVWIDCQVSRSAACRTVHRLRYADGSSALCDSILCVDQPVQCDGVPDLHIYSRGDMETLHHTGIDKHGGYNRFNSRAYRNLPVLLEPGTLVQQMEFTPQRLMGSFTSPVTNPPVFIIGIIRI